MNIKTLKESLPFLFKARICPLIVGAHGVGKSQAVRQIADDAKIGFLDLRLGLVEPGDLTGLPDLRNGQTAFAAPAWLPREGAGILFLDELNRSRRDTLQAVFQLILDRRIGDYELPEGWNVVAACNPDNGEYSVTDISDKALMDRFCVLHLVPSADEFFSHGRQQQFEEGLLGFLSDQPGLLDGKGEVVSMLEERQPSRRSWAAVSRILALNPPTEIARPLVQGLVGVSASVALFKYLETFDRRIAAADVLERFELVRPRLEKLIEGNRTDALTAAGAELFEFLEKAETLTATQSANLLAFLLALPYEVGIAVTSRLILQKAVREAIGADKALVAYCKRARKGAKAAA